MNASATTDTADIRLACPQCHGLVRVPAQRMDDGPKCPRCKSGLLTERPIELDSTSFSSHAERGTLPVLVDFWAEWCGPCKMMSPVLNRFAAQRSGALQVGKVDTDAQPELAGRFNIRSIPTLMLFRGGIEIGRQSGAMDLTRLSRWVDSKL